MADLSFINQIAPYIIAEAKERGYKICSTVVAQAIIESNWGKSQLSLKYFNFFGIKAGQAWLKSGKPSINMNTKEEYVVGHQMAIKDYFRCYSDMKSGVKGYYDFINTKRYANLKTAVTPKQYAEFLKADGYATSSTYVQTLVNTVNKYQLDRFDEGTSPSVDYVINNVVNVKTTLNIRNLPSKDDGLVVGSLHRDQVIEIKGYENGWYQIDAGKWVFADYIVSNTGTVAVKTSLNLRSEPSTNSEIVSRLMNGDKLKLLNYKNNFYMVLTEDKRFGWCSADYVNII
jgi:SH3-like domain-containing protein